LVENISAENKERITIILHSTAYDRVSCALCMALAALSAGTEAHILLTAEGIKRFTKGNLTSIGEETPLRLHAEIQEGLEKGAMQPLDEQLACAKEMGLKIYACPNAMATYNVAKRNLVGVDKLMGLVTFLKLASGAQANWYI
jgi:peroxiredoxin family protein